MSGARGDGAGAAPAVVAENLTKEYGQREGDGITAVDDVSLTIDSGSIVGVLGPNGAGKTTAMKCILGLIEQTSGEVAVGGVDPHADPRAAYRQVSAVLEGARNLYWRLTVRENVRFFARLQSIDPRDAGDEHERLLEVLGLEEKAEEPVRDLSRGLKQKAALACALARETPVLFLDEPTLGLDVETSRLLVDELRRLVDQDDRTVVVSSHDMDVIEELCDRVVIVNDGRIVADSAVDELVDLFQVQTYRVDLADDLPASARDRLEREFGAGDWETGEDGVSFEAILESGEKLYGLVDALRDAGATPEKLAYQEPDLEDAFLRVIEGEAGDAGEAAGTDETATAVEGPR